MKIQDRKAVVAPESARSRGGDLDGFAGEGGGTPLEDRLLGLYPHAEHDIGVVGPELGFDESVDSAPRHRLRLALWRVALVAFCIFTVARVLYSIVYVLGKQPWRTMLFIVGNLAALVLVGNIVYLLVRR